MNFGDLKESFMCFVHADATAFTYLTLLVPVAQFTTVDEPSCFFGGIHLDLGLALVYIVYI